jgi:hypothetical protein
MDDLPEEVLQEVFSRVGNVKDLFRLAVTCRRWLCRFTDPAFLHGLWGEGHRAHLHGFFFQQQTRREGASVFEPTFLPTPGSPLRALVSFDDGNFTNAEPLAARRGIVLMQLAPRAVGTRLFDLCNPITGERHVLPPLRCSCFADVYTCYAIITAADSDLDAKKPSSSARFAFSQLLLAILTTDRKVNLHSYSAATRSWSAPAMCLDKVTHISPVGERSAIVHRGAAHWLWINNDNNVLYKLSTEVGKHPCVLSLRKLPQLRVGGSPLLCVGRDGQLSVACAYPMHVTVWTQHGEDTAWLRTAVIRLPMPTTLNQIRLHENPPHLPLEKWLDFDRGSMLVLHRGSTVSILDLDKKVVEKIMDDCLLPTFSHVFDQTRSVAYKMDLVKFFLLHLGGLCSGRRPTE